MTVNTLNNRQSYNGNGVTLAFAFPNYFLKDQDLVVLSVSALGVVTTLVLNTDYTVAGAGVPAGGTVTTTVAPITGSKLVIYRDPAETQDLDLVENDPLPAEETEKAFDKIVMMVQRLKDLISRAAILSDGFTGTFDPTLPVPVPDTVLAFNPAGTGFAIGPTITDISNAAGNAADAAASAAAADASATAAAVSAAAADASADDAQDSADDAAASAASITVPLIQQEEPTGVVDGLNTVFTLSMTPVAHGALVFLGTELKENIDYTLSGMTITLAVAPALGQKLYVWYVVSDLSTTRPIQVAQETPTGLIDGMNDTFTLVGYPGSKLSTLVFVDGLPVNKSGWSLIQGPSSSQIKFSAGFVPAPAQSLYVAYFINVFASAGTSTPAPSGGGALIPSGSLASPAIVNPTAGVQVTTDQRQLAYIKSQGGQQTVTANPQIAPGNTDGQELILYGTSDTDYSSLQDGTGVSMNGAWNAKANSLIHFVWNSQVWSEISRR